ncbi:MAG: proton-conducting transporter membrane subunit [Terrimicrobiaceae bacterium]
MNSEALIWMPVIALLLPVLALIASVFKRVRRLLPHGLWLLPWPAVAAAILGVNAGPITLAWLPFQPVFFIDPPGALLLGTSAFLWSMAGFSLPVFFPHKPAGARFCVFWLLTMIGSLGVFIADDLVSFLICYVLVSLPAYVLIVQENSQSTRRAGAIYLGFALVGEGVLIMAFVLLTVHTPEAGLRIHELVASMLQNPDSQLTTALLILGFGMKIALVPLHFWMPLTYTAAPIPVAAVLSGAGVKAGVIGLLRFLPWEGGMTDWGHLLVVIGFFGAFYGVIVGITQSHPKTILAYSSVSQMGFLASLLGMGLITPTPGLVVIAAFYAAHHVLLKGGLFLAVGLAQTTNTHRVSLILLPAGVLGLGLAGLPLTGGFLAKYAAKEPLGDGWASMFAACSSVGTAMLMIHFVSRLAKIEAPSAASLKVTRLQVSWVLLAIVSLALPWFLFDPVGFGPLSQVLAVDALWKSLWPVLLGVGLGVGVMRWGMGLGVIPSGDILALFHPLTQVATTLGKSAERVDAVLRHWPVACVSFLLLLLVLTLSAFW